MPTWGRGGGGGRRQPELFDEGEGRAEGWEQGDWEGEEGGREGQSRDWPRKEVHIRVWGGMQEMEVGDEGFMVWHTVFSYRSSSQRQMLLHLVVAFS